jgi:hypothetical protein
MKKFASLILASVFILALFSLSSLAAVNVMGGGQMGDRSFNFMVTDRSDAVQGLLVYFDRSSNKYIGGKITSVTANSANKVTMGGSYETPDKVNHTFTAVAEDLGKPGADVDKFSITDSFGYSDSGIISKGEIIIVSQ